MGAAYKIPVSVLVVIHTPDLRVLLLERADRPGFWQSVTGSQHAGETLRQTAQRELAEETGLDASSFELVDWRKQNQYEIYRRWRSRYAPGVTHNTEHVYSMQLPQALPVTLAADEHVAWRWLPWREAAALTLSSTNREAILALPGRRTA